MEITSAVFSVNKNAEKMVTASKSLASYIETQPFSVYIIVEPEKYIIL